MNSKKELKIHKQIYFVYFFYSLIKNVNYKKFFYHVHIFMPNSLFFSPTDYVRFVTGFRGSRKLKVGDYSFTKNKVSGHKMYWSCARAALHKCKARVVTTDVDGKYFLSLSG